MIFRPISVITLSFSGRLKSSPRSMDALADFNCWKTRETRIYSASKVLWRPLGPSCLDNVCIWHFESISIAIWLSSDESLFIPVPNSWRKLGFRITFINECVHVTWKAIPGFTSDTLARGAPGLRVLSLACNAVDTTEQGWCRDRWGVLWGPIQHGL